MDIENLSDIEISLIVEKVWEKIIELNKHILVVFTASKIGFDEALQEFSKLYEDGFRFSVILSEEACKLHNINKIKESLKPKELYEGNLDVAPEAFINRFNTVVVPSLSINSASKIANNICDTLVTRVVSNSIMKGKNVIIAIDGCCPDNPVRVQLGYTFTPKHKEVLRQNIEAMRDYGAKITVIENLYQKVSKAATFNFKKSSSQKATNEAVVKSKVIGRNDVLSNKDSKTIKISRSALITQLAADTARAYGITFVRE